MYLKLSIEEREDLNMELNLSAQNCVIVSKNEKKGNDNKSYYSMGFSQNRSNTFSLSCNKEIFDRVTDNMFYQPVDLRVRYIESTKFGNYIQLIDMLLIKK